MSTHKYVSQRNKKIFADSLAGSFQNKGFYIGYFWSNKGFSGKIFNKIKSKKRLIFSSHFQIPCY